MRLLPLIVACLIAVPALAETSKQKVERCTAQAGIVEAAITHRQDGRRQKRTTRKILKSDPVKGSKYEANVDVLVAWIYTLPKAQLNADTVQTFQQACLDFAQQPE